ncbi:MAG: hypothetical protein WKG07_48120 [Hymenobacter sp.]
MPILTGCRLRGAALLAAGLSLAGMASAQTLPAGPTPLPVDTVRLTLPDAEQRFVQGNLQLLAQRFNITAAQALAVQARLIDNPTVQLDQNAVLQAVHQRQTGRQHRGGPASMPFRCSSCFRWPGGGRRPARRPSRPPWSKPTTWRTWCATCASSCAPRYYDVLLPATDAARVRRRDSLAAPHRGPLPEPVREGQHCAQGSYSPASLPVYPRKRAAGAGDGAGQFPGRPAHSAARLDPLGLPAGGGWPPRCATSRWPLTPSSSSPTRPLVRRADLLARRAEVQRQQPEPAPASAPWPPPTWPWATPTTGLAPTSTTTTSLTLGVAVPVFNRNQGNIQAAKAQISMAARPRPASSQLAGADATCTRPTRWPMRQDELCQHTSRDTTPFARLIDNIEQSYTKRLISMVEYLDFYEAYKNNVIQLNTLRANRMRAFETLN